jgi:hypothetical protein
MTIRKVEVERFSVTSSQPFDVVVSALNAVIGNPDLAEFMKATKVARTVGGAGECG